MSSRHPHTIYMNLKTQVPRLLMIPVFQPLLLSISLSVSFSILYIYIHMMYISLSFYPFLSGFSLHSSLIWLQPRKRSGLTYWHFPVSASRLPPSVFPPLQNILPALFIQRQRDKKRKEVRRKKDQKRNIWKRK